MQPGEDRKDLQTNHNHSLNYPSLWSERSLSIQSPHLSSSGSRGPVPTCSGTRVGSSRWPSPPGLADRPRGAPCCRRGPAAPGWPLSPPAPSPPASGSGRSPGAKGSADHPTKTCKVFRTLEQIRLILLDVYGRKYLLRISGTYKTLASERSRFCNDNCSLLF